ncbi:MAG TPA: nitrate reductase [Verrucomicrobiae bacterium]|jgi:assimilatory nitrate reductase catalytic subunit
MKFSFTDLNPNVRQWHGPLTKDHAFGPGHFGLGHLPAKLAPDATTTMVCGFCSTGCGLRVHLKNGEAVNLSADTAYPVNLGMACPKGWEALTPLEAPDRGTRPLLRDEQGVLRPTDWQTAVTEFCAQMKGIQLRHGPHSIAFLGTGQICTEEMALLGCFFKFGMGGLHCDSNTRQCMATAHVAYKQSFGFDAPPYTYADFEQSDTLIFIGSNPCIAHPIMWQRVMRNSRRPAIFVIDPRKTETALAATHHLAIKPKSDLILLYGIANLLAQSGWIDQTFISQHTAGYAEFAQFVRAFTPEKVALETGLSVGHLFRFAEAIHTGSAVSFWWTMGVNQGHEATRTAQAVINLALMTGNIGRPGTGANSITGQCNAMGSRLYANITSLIGGHDSANPAHRAKVSNILGIRESSIPTEPSLAYDQILDGVRDGKIKGLWIIATNSSHSWINQGGLGDLFKKLDFLVVQDMYPTTETARLAHLYLPAAGWGEKEGTFINSERRVGLVKKVRRAPGEALSDFNIFKLVAEEWGSGEMFRKWRSPEATFQLLKEISRDQPCDITGISNYAFIDGEGGMQWPFSEKEAATAEINAQSGAPDKLKERRLFADGKFYHADGKARFIFEEPRIQPEKTDASFPFTLLTGRGSSAQWHTGSRTNKSEVLRALAPAICYVEINPEDAKRLAIEANAKVYVRSRRGRLTATAFITPTVQRGQVFIPMHYAETNRLTLASFDPYSRQPSYKSCAVAIEPA